MMRTLLFILVFTCCSLTADAHKPLDTAEPATKAQPIVIRAPQKSWVAYNRLSGNKDLDYYLLAEVRKGDPIDATLLVPAIDRLADFHPSLALLGPGLPVETGSLSEEILDTFLQIDPAEGVMVKTGKRAAETFFEPFTQTKYWPRQSIHLRAPESGRYYLAVFDLNGQGDKYVLSIGQQEDWKGKDLLQFPKIWWQVRMFAEKERSTYVLVGALAFIAFSVLVLLIKGRS